VNIKDFTMEVVTFATEA